LREKYRWLVAGGWFILTEKYCWLVDDNANKQGEVPKSLAFLHISKRKSPKLYSVVTSRIKV
jgi:hypothetical protein